MRTCFIYTVLFVSTFIITSCKKESKVPILSINENGTLVINDSLQFSCTESQGISYSWNFGDGTTSTLANPYHVYQSPGIYKVTLSFSDQASLQCATKSITITSGANAIAGPWHFSFLWSNYSPAAGCWVKFKEPDTTLTITQLNDSSLQFLNYRLSASTILSKNNVIFYEYSDFVDSLNKLTTAEIAFYPNRDSLSAIVEISEGAWTDIKNTYTARK